MKLKIIFTFIFGIFLIYGGVNHLIKPDFYLPFVPDFLSSPKKIVYLSGIAEILIGLGVFIPKTRKFSAFLILVMMLSFLPIHIWDVFRDDPAIGSKSAVLIRLPVQFLFIAWAYWISKPLDFKSR